MLLGGLEDLVMRPRTSTVVLDELRDAVDMKQMFQMD